MIIKRRKVIGPHGMLKAIHEYYKTLPKEEMEEITHYTEHPSLVTIRDALNYRLNSKLGKHIRLVAREHFGGVITQINIEED